MPQKDGFDNTVFWCSIGSVHDVLRYGSRGIACVEEPGQPAPPPNPCLRFAGLRTKPGRILMQVSSAMARGKTLAALDALCHAVHSLLRYQPGQPAFILRPKKHWRADAACARITRTFL